MLPWITRRTINIRVTPGEKLGFPYEYASPIFYQNKADRMPKVRQHNEWFRTVSLGGRKSCPNCRAKLNGGSIWVWGEYIRAKWHNVKYFCQSCYETEVKAPLENHAGDCGCQINMVGYHTNLPDWLTLDKKDKCAV